MFYGDFDNRLTSLFCLFSQKNVAVPFLLIRRASPVPLKSRASAIRSDNSEGKSPKLNGRNPKLRHHKASGQAIVTIDGRDVYLGAFDDPDSSVQYALTIKCWRNVEDVHAKVGAEPTLTLARVIAKFLEYAKTNYVRNGINTNEYRAFKRLAGEIVALHSEIAALPS